MGVGENENYHGPAHGLIATQRRCNYVGARSVVPAQVVILLTLLSDIICSFIYSLEHLTHTVFIQTGSFRPICKLLHILQLSNCRTL